MILERNKLRNLAKKFKLNQIVLFGSRATGQTNQASDFDFGILPEKHLSVRDRDQLLIDMSQVLKLPIQKTDITFLDRASPLLLYECLKNARLLYGDPAAFIGLKLYAIKRYQDHQKFFNLLNRYLKKEYA